MVDCIEICNGIYLELGEMLEGKCPKCGLQFWGWALFESRNQSCPKCGTGLLITEDGRTRNQGYSPFTAPEYRIKSSGASAPDTDDISNTALQEQSNT